MSKKKMYLRIEPVGFIPHQVPIEDPDSIDWTVYFDCGENDFEDEEGVIVKPVFMTPEEKDALKEFDGF